jgi:hypothetical protein
MHCHQQELLHPCLHSLYDALNASCIKPCLKNKKHVVIGAIPWHTKARMYALECLNSRMVRPDFNYEGGYSVVIRIKIR